MDNSQAADHLPFFLRAWWLRHTSEYFDVSWGEPDNISAPLWSKYSDPICDLASAVYDENI